MQGVSVTELCELLHISRATWYLRLGDGQFTVREISRLAKRFGVSVQDIVDGRAYFSAGGQQGISAQDLQSTDQYITPLLSLVRGEAVQTSPPRGVLTAVA